MNIKIGDNIILNSTYFLHTKNVKGVVENIEIDCKPPILIKTDTFGYLWVYENNITKVKLHNRNGANKCV